MISTKVEYGKTISSKIGIPAPLAKNGKASGRVIRHDTHDDEQDVEKILFAIDLDQRRIIMQAHIAWLTPSGQLFLEVMAIDEMKAMKEG